MLCARSVGCVLRLSHIVPTNSWRKGMGAQVGEETGRVFGHYTRTSTLDTVSTKYSLRSHPKRHAAIPHLSSHARDFDPPSTTIRRTVFVKSKYKCNVNIIPFSSKFCLTC